MTSTARAAIASLGVLCLFATASVLPAHAKTLSCDVPGQFVDQGNHWTGIRYPADDKEPPLSPGRPDNLDGDGIRAFAVDPNDADRIFTTNSYSVMRSLDGGCSWRKVFELPDVPGTDGYTRDTVVIDSLLISESKEHPSIFLTLWHRNQLSSLYTEYVRIPHPRILVSRDGGDSWTRSDSGVNPIDDNVRIAPVPGEPSSLLLVSERSPFDINIGGFYTSEDGGQTWSAMSEIVDRVGGKSLAIQDFAVTGSKSVWAWLGHSGSDGHTALIYHSTDGARTWEKETVPEALGGFDQLDVQRWSDGIDHLVLASGRFVLVSNDGAKTWTPVVQHNCTEQTIRWISFTPSHRVLASCGVGGLGSGDAELLRLDRRRKTFFWTRLYPTSIHNHCDVPENDSSQDSCFMYAGQFAGGRFYALAQPNFGFPSLTVEMYGGRV